MTELGIKMLSVGCLVGHPGNRGVGDIESLTESVRERGVMVPLRVRVKEDGVWEVLEGHRRKAAAEAAGVGEVVCLVCEASDKEAAEVVLVSNLERLDLSPMEEAAAVAAMVEVGWDADELAGRLARSEEWVQLRLGLALAGPECLKEAAAERRVEWGAVKAVLACPEDSREEAARLVVQPEFQVESLNGRQAWGVLEPRFIAPAMRRKEWERMEAKRLAHWRAEFSGVAAGWGGAPPEVVCLEWGEKVPEGVRFVRASREIEEGALTPAAPSPATWAMLAAWHGSRIVVVPDEEDPSFGRAVVDAAELEELDEVCGESAAWLKVKGDDGAKGNGGGVSAEWTPATADEDGGDDVGGGDDDVSMARPMAFYFFRKGYEAGLDEWDCEKGFAAAWDGWVEADGEEVGE